MKELLNARCCEPLTLDDIARDTGYTTPYVCRIFLAHTGLTIHRYRNQLRLRRALGRLPGVDRNLTRLALDFGFSSQSHFTAAFRDEFGLTPAQYRAGVDSAKIATFLRQLA